MGSGLGPIGEDVEGIIEATTFETAKDRVLPREAARWLEGCEA